MSTGPRGFGITKADVEASRLVFVSLRDSHPKRKVAVPVPDGYSWDQFINQVKMKLRLSEVGAVYFASTGERVTKLDGLEDIDELCVEEVSFKPDSNGVYTSQLKDEASTSEIQISMTPTTSNLRPTISDSRTTNQFGVMDNGDIDQQPEEDEDEKYTKRSSLLRRMTQRIFPNAFGPILPLSNKTEEKIPKKRKRKNSGRNLRVMFLACAAAASLLTMIYLYIHTSTHNKDI